MRINPNPATLEAGDLVETDYFEGSYLRAVGTVYRIVGFVAYPSQSGRMTRTVPHAPASGPALPELDAAWFVPAGKAKPKKAREAQASAAFDPASLPRQQAMDFDLESEAD